MNIPVEIQARILWYNRHDPVTLHRMENVCTLWADIVQFFEIYRRLQFRTVKVFFTFSALGVPFLNYSLLFGHSVRNEIHLFSTPTHLNCSF